MLKQPLENITGIKTKSAAIIVYRNMMRDQTLQFAKLGEAIGYTRQQTYNWDEILPENVRNQVIGFLARINPE